MKPGSVAPETKLLKGCKKVSVDKNKKKKRQHNNKKHYCNLNEMSPFLEFEMKSQTRKAQRLDKARKTRVCKCAKKEELPGGGPREGKHYEGRMTRQRDYQVGTDNDGMKNALWTHSVHVLARHTKPHPMDTADASMYIHTYIHPARETSRNQLGFART